MGPLVRSSLLAGFIASAIWMFISVAVDMAKEAILVGGLVFLIGTAAVTAAVSTVVSKGRT